MQAGDPPLARIHWAVCSRFLKNELTETRLKNPPLVAIVLAAASLLAAAPVHAQKLALKLGHVGEPGSLYESTSKIFAKRANELLGDKAEVQVFGSSQLGNDSELLQKLKLGQITFSMPSSIMSSVSDEFGVFEMPYIVQSRDHAKAIAAELGKTVFDKAAAAKGYKILAWYENGFRHITNNSRPVNVPADLKGIKLRTPKGEWRLKMFQLYGANPTPMAYSEVFTALKTGVIDGQENPYAQIWSAKFQEVQKYLSITGHVYTPAYLLTSSRSFGALPPDVQKALTQAATETQSTAYEMAARLDSELLDKLRSSGVTVNEADKQAFVAASKPVYEEFAKTVAGGADLISQVQALAR